MVYDEVEKFLRLPATSEPEITSKGEVPDRTASLCPERRTDRTMSCIMSSNACHRWELSNCHNCLKRDSDCPTSSRRGELLGELPTSRYRSLVSATPKAFKRLLQSCVKIILGDWTFRSLNTLASVRGIRLFMS